jgi:outer membrane murein-binding lipoprotein Lpp
MPRESGFVPTIGKPVANTQIHLLDEQGNPVPVGVIGELYIGGDGVARGYLDRPGLSAERFVPDPWSSQAGMRMYRTGDLARYRPDGQLEFLGRKDFQVKLRGYRIELGEIETRLQQHSGVQGAIVLARSDIGRETRLVAYYVSPQAIPSAQLRQYLRDGLPDYMVPAIYVHLNAWPLTPNGKIDRIALPTPVLSTSETSTPSLAESSTQKQLAALWRELLQSDEPGLDDNFFDLGGHSLLLLQAHQRLGTLFPGAASLRLVDLYAHPTIRSLAARLDGLTTDTDKVRDEARQRAAQQKLAQQKNRIKNKRNTHDA